MQKSRRIGNAKNSIKDLYMILPMEIIPLQFILYNYSYLEYRLDDDIHHKLMAQRHHSKTDYVRKTSYQLVHALTSYKMNASNNIKIASFMATWWTGEKMLKIFTSSEGVHVNFNSSFPIWLAASNPNHIQTHCVYGSVHKEMGHELPVSNASNRSSNTQKGVPV